MIYITTWWTQKDTESSKTENNSDFHYAIFSDEIAALLFYNNLKINHSHITLQCQSWGNVWIPSIGSLNANNDVTKIQGILSDLFMGFSFINDQLKGRNK